jgi:hypothetical protein
MHADSLSISQSNFKPITLLISGVLILLTHFLTIGIAELSPNFQISGLYSEELANISGIEFSGWFIVIIGVVLFIPHVSKPPAPALRPGQSQAGDDGHKASQGVEADINHVEDPVGQQRLDALVEQAQQRRYQHGEHRRCGDPAAVSLPFGESLVNDDRNQTVLDQVRARLRGRHAQESDEVGAGDSQRDADLGHTRPRFQPQHQDGHPDQEQAKHERVVDQTPGAEFPCQSPGQAEGGVDRHQDDQGPEPEALLTIGGE